MIRRMLLSGLQPETLEHLRRSWPPRCGGCHEAATPRNPDLWWICDYHQGYDEGVVLFKARQS